MPDIIKNLNYSAEETNDILASVATKARDIDLKEVKLDVADMTNLMHDYMEEKNAKFEELEGVVGSFEERLTNLSTDHTTLSENFTTKSTEINEKFASIDSNISSTREEINSINSNIEGISENIETLTTSLLTTDSNISALQELVDGLFENKSTLASYGISDAKIEGDIVTLGEVTIEPLTKDSWKTEKQELLLEIEKLKNRLDILEAPDHTLVDSVGNIFASKDGNYFVTK